MNDQQSSNLSLHDHHHLLLLTYTNTEGAGTGFITQAFSTEPPLLFPAHVIIQLIASVRVLLLLFLFILKQQFTIYLYLLGREQDKRKKNNKTKETTSILSKLSEPQKGGGEQT